MKLPSVPLYLPRLRWKSLYAKFLWPVAGLMILSLAISTFAFIGSTALSRNRLISQRLDQDIRRVAQVLAGRAETVQAAAAVLVADEEIRAALANKTDVNLARVDARAVMVRNRFNLDLIQIYDTRNTAWVNLVTADLFRISTLLQETTEDTSQVIAADGRLLLVSRASIPKGGTIITGLDLGSELKRIARAENIVATLGLQAGATSITSEPGLSFQALQEQEDHLSRQMALTLGGQEVTLVVSHSTTEINRVMQTGLWVVILASALTTALLIFLGVRLVNSMVYPIRVLAEASERVTRHHDFLALSRPIGHFNPLHIGEDDEIGQLANAFRQMLAELQDLYQDLESKVEARARQIAMVAEIAQATTSSLDLDQVLRTAVEQIWAQFHYYFAGVFILDPHTGVVSLRQAAGTATIENANLRIELPLTTNSLITTAIKQRERQVVQDVRTSSDYLPLIALPKTRSEAVFPLIHAGMAIGALDIQSEEINAFSADVVQTLNTLAVQIATAIQNAILYDRQRSISRHLAEIDHLKMQLLGKISHELRTPLNAIIGFSKILLKGIDGEINETQRADLTSILENGQHLLRLINDILDISQFEAGEVNLQLRPINLRQEVLFAVSHLQEELEKKPIRLELDISPTLPTVQGDIKRIQQVLINLLANAIKLTETGTITISATASDQWVIVTIEDTGIGLAPEEIDKIFQPFSQADDSSTRRFGGLGLGLSIARYIVELHGGHIWAEGRPGYGSTFTFTLPLDPSVSRISAQMMDFKETRILYERNEI